MDLQVSREELVAAVELLGVLGRLRKSARMAEQSGKLSERMALSLFNLVVIGEFKRGKSTLINALLREQVLPTATVPLTSVATLVKYGALAQAKICFILDKVFVVK